MTKLRSTHQPEASISLNKNGTAVDLQAECRAIMAQLAPESAGEAGRLLAVIVGGAGLHQTGRGRMIDDVLADARVPRWVA
jgi:hypothetical protein